MTSYINVRMLEFVFNLSSEVTPNIVHFAWKKTAHMKAGLTPAENCLGDKLHRSVGEIAAADRRRFLKVAVRGRLSGLTLPSEHF
jgi:hypothetical protein